MQTCLLALILLASMPSFSAALNTHYSNSSTKLDFPDEVFRTDVGRNLEKRLTPILSNEYAIRGHCIQDALKNGGALNPWTSVFQITQALWSSQDGDTAEAFENLGAGDGSFLHALGIDEDDCVYVFFFYDQDWVDREHGYQARNDLLIDTETGVVIAVWQRPLRTPIVNEGQIPPAFPPVKQWSDIAWLTWLASCTTNDVEEDQRPHCINRLEWVIFSDPSYDPGETGDVMDYLGDTDPPPWPSNIYEYSATGNRDIAMDNATRIIGSPNGLGAAWLISSQFGSINALPDFSVRGMIDRIHWFTGTDGPHLMAFHISKTLEVATKTSSSTAKVPGVPPISVPVAPIAQPVATITWTGDDWETPQFPDTWTMDGSLKSTPG